MYKNANILFKKLICVVNNIQTIRHGINGQIIGFRVDSAPEVDFVEEELIPEFQEGHNITLRLFGRFSEGDEIALTDHIATCNFLIKDDFPVSTCYYIFYTFFFCIFFYQF